MDTITRLVCSPKQAKELIAKLKDAVSAVDVTKEIEWVRVVLEQSTHKGPWGLTIGVMPNQE